MNHSRGFTLIELITVIAILGALAVIALPRFINLQGEAQQAAVDGVAGALGAGAAINYAARLAGNASALPVTTCPAVATTLADGLPADYVITAGNIGDGATLGNSGTCTLTGPAPGNSTATFTGYVVP